MKNKKIILGLLIFLAVILLNCTDTFAYTFTSNVNGQEYTVPDLDTVGEEYVEYLENGYLIQCLTNKSILVVPLNSNSYFYHHSIKEGVDVIAGSGSFARFYIDNTSSRWDSVPPSNTLGNAGYVYYGADVYTDINKTDLFFQLPVVEEVQGTIAPLLEKEKMGEVLKEIVAILPLIVSVLVSLIALRKAWQVLSTFLRTS